MLPNPETQNAKVSGILVIGVLSGDMNGYHVFHFSYLCTKYQLHFQVDASDTKSFKCYYYTNNNHPLLIVSPAKLEELNLEISLSFIHELMTEGEISLLQSLASGKVNS